MEKTYTIGEKVGFGYSSAIPSHEIEVVEIQENGVVLKGEYDGRKTAVIFWNYKNSGRSGSTDIIESKQYPDPMQVAKNCLSRSYKMPYKGNSLVDFLNLKEVFDGAGIYYPLVIKYMGRPHPTYSQTSQKAYGKFENRLCYSMDADMARGYACSTVPREVATDGTEWCIWREKTKKWHAATLQEINIELNIKE